MMSFIVHIFVALFICSRLPFVYRSFVTYRTRFSQVFSYIIQLRRNDSRESCVTL